MYQVLLIAGALLLLFPFLTILKRKTLRKTYGVCVFILLLIYIACGLYFTVFSRIPHTKYRYELVPFASYARMFTPVVPQVKDEINGALAQFFLSSKYPIQGNILNIFLFIPFPILVLELFPMIKPRRVMLIAFLMTLCIEVLQFSLRLGWFETDDLLHNMVGTVIGLFCFRIWIKNAT